jgi:hypothetical protein
MNNDTTKRLAEAFLRWPLPESVCADLCATKQGPSRVGTNLLSYTEAEQMMREVVEPEIASLQAMVISLTQSRDNWECAAKANDAVVAQLKASARTHHRDLGITLLDAKWLDPECYKGCQSLVLKQRAERAESLLVESAEALESEVESERKAMWLKIRAFIDAARATVKQETK